MLFKIIGMILECQKVELENERKNGQSYSRTYPIKY
jgi:hypothetical protein